MWLSFHVGAGNAGTTSLHSGIEFYILIENSDIKHVAHILLQWAQGELRTHFSLDPLITMATWDVEDLAKEISDMEVIFQRNNGSQLVPRMKEALQCKVDGIHLFTASTFLRLCDALEKSLLPPEMKAELQASFERKAGSSFQGATRLQSTPQSMTMPWNYLSQSEWQQVQDGINTIDAAHLLIKRMKTCGLKSLKEDTKKYTTCFLISMQMKTTSVLPPVVEMYKLAQYVLDTFGTVVVQPLHAGLAKYPPSPYDIGEAWVG